jgi:hypothetical protein
MTKAFNTAPQPKTLSSADKHFIEKGPGKDNVPSSREVRLAFLLPMPLHSRFKSLCASRGLKMADEIRGLLERRIEELESGKKKDAEVTRLKQLLGEASTILNKEFSP